MTHLKKRRNGMKQILFSAVIAFSIIAITSPVHAVGPYFENESPGRGQFGGPNRIWPRPGEPLWSPSSPRFQSREAFRKGEIVLRRQKWPDEARAAAPEVSDKPSDK